MTRTQYRQARRLIRASWHAKPDTARANIVRLTSWIGA